MPRENPLHPGVATLDAGDKSSIAVLSPRHAKRTFVETM
jgi:hypothetical protein